MQSEEGGDVYIPATAHALPATLKVDAASGLRKIKQMINLKQKLWIFLLFVFVKADFDIFEMMLAVVTNVCFLFEYILMLYSDFVSIYPFLIDQALVWMSWWPNKTAHRRS